MSKSLRVLVVDDHPLFREALMVAFERAAPQAATVVQSGSLAEGLAALRDGPFDLILLDLLLSDATGFDGLVRMKAEAGSTPLFVVSGREGREIYRRAKDLGADGYLPKSTPLAELAAALATALDGGAWFPEDLDNDSASATHRLSTLTPAQTKVLNGLADGLLNKQIAYEMGISEATVKAHMTAIFRKLGVLNRTQALLAYKEATGYDIPSAS